MILFLNTGDSKNNIQLTFDISNAQYLEQIPQSLGHLVLISLDIISLSWTSISPIPRFLEPNFGSLVRASLVNEILTKHLPGLRFHQVETFLMEPKCTHRWGFIEGKSLACKQQAARSNWFQNIRLLAK